MSEDYDEFAQSDEEVEEKEPVVFGEAASDEDSLDCVCTECASTLPEKRVAANPFFQSGQSVPCFFCGGVTMLVWRSQRANAIKQINRQRGLS